MSLLLVSATSIANRIRGNNLKKLDLVGKPEIRALEEAANLLRPSEVVCVIVCGFRTTTNDSIGKARMARCLCA
jgi:hypothetical protein